MMSNQMGGTFFLTSRNRQSSLRQPTETRILPIYSRFNLYVPFSFQNQKSHFMKQNV